MSWVFEAFLDEAAQMPTPGELKKVLGGRAGFRATKGTVRFNVEGEVMEAFTSGVEALLGAFPGVRLEEANVRGEGVA